jgi:hypothetical protein
MGAYHLHKLKGWLRVVVVAADPLREFPFFESLVPSWGLIRVIILIAARRFSLS